VPLSAVPSFMKPGDYGAEIRGAKSEFAATTRGSFSGQLTGIDCTDLWTQRFSDNLLLLLCHKLARLIFRWQHGHRVRVRAMARAITTRTDVIEFGTCRSGLTGGSAGSITVG